MTSPAHIAISGRRSSHGADDSDVVLSAPPLRLFVPSRIGRRKPAA